MSSENRVLDSPANCVIRLRAYELWEANGHRLWEPEKDWSKAELEFEAHKKSSERRQFFIKWRATELWLLHRRPNHRDWEFWLRAQREVDNPEAYINRVRRRAYEIWEQAGRPEGESAKHWAKAEEEIAVGDS